MIPSTSRRSLMAKSKCSHTRLFRTGRSVYIFRVNVDSSMKYNGTTDTNQQQSQQPLMPQQKAQVPQRQIPAPDNNNHQMLDASLVRRKSRVQENIVADKSALTLDASHAKQPNDTHYIKNKTLQSPVNRYKVRLINCQR